MKFEIMSRAASGNFVAVCATEAPNAEEAIRLTANFCAMTGVTIAGAKPANIPTVVWENAPQGHKL